MMKLHGRLETLSSQQASKTIRSVTVNRELNPQEAKSKAYLSLEGDAPPGFDIVLHRVRPSGIDSAISNYVLPSYVDYLGEGDVIRIGADGSFRVLFRSNSRHNSILLTERCDHYCLMCSQPPKNVDDSWVLDEATQLIKLIPKDTAEIGFTGGEPTLYGDKFIELLKLTKECLPRTSVHTLSNGRAFKDIAFARKYAAVDHHDMMVGIPIYSDDPVRHDYVVQSRNAFSETVRGILNLKSVNQRVEIRVVIHNQTVDRLVNLCEFIARNLLFVDHVALMGLEITGFTRANLDLLWIDPYDYKDVLSEAVRLLESYGMYVSVYNHPRCVVNDDVMRAYRKSISDWKNEYLDECARCSKLGECGGLFSSAVQFKHSAHIGAFK